MRIFRTVFFCLVAVQFCLTQDQVLPSRPHAVKQFYTVLQQRKNDTTVPDWDEFYRFRPELSSARADDINEALPSIFATSADGNTTVRSYGGFALLAISLRPDGAELLGQYIPQIGDVLNSPDARLQATGVFVLGSIKSGAFPILLNFVNRTDRDEAAQIGAISTMLRLRPDDDSAIRAVENFAARSLRPEKRINVLQAIRGSSARDSRLSDLAIRTLSDEHPGVKVAAIAALVRMGPSAVSKAEPALKKLREDKLQPHEVKIAAEKSLETIGR